MQIPEYESPQVQPDALPGVRVQPLEDPAAGAVGSGLQQLGAGVQSAADDAATVLRREQRKANAIWAANAHTQFAHDGTTATDGNTGGTADVSAAGQAAPGTSEDDIGHVAPSGPSQTALDAKANSAGSGLSSKGILNEQGMAAAQFAHPTMSWLAQRRDEIAAAAPNDEAKQLFLETSGRQLEDYRGVVERHSSQQYHVALEQSLVARSAVGLNTIGRDASAPGATDSQILYSLDSNTDEVARTIHELNPGELGDEQVAAYKQKATELVMQHYIDAKDVRGAQNLFDQRREDLGDKADALGKTIRVLGNQQDAVHAAGDIMKSALEPSGLYNIAEIDRATLALPADKQTDLVQKEVASRKALAQSQNSATVSKLYTDAAGQWEQNGHNLNAIDAQTTEKMKSMDPDGWYKLEERDRQWKEQQKRGGAKGSSADQDLWFSTWMWNHDKNRDQYKDMTPEQLARDAGDRVTPKQLQKMQDALREDKGQKATSSDSTPAWQRDRIIQGVSGAFPGQKGNPALDPNERGQVYNAVEEKLRSEREAYRAAHKAGDLPAADVDRIVGEQLQKVKVAGTGFFSDDQVPLAQYQTDPKYRGKGIEGPVQVPDASAQAIRNQFQGKRGRAPSDAEVQQIYKAHVESATGYREPSPVAAPVAPSGDATKADQPDRFTHPANASVTEEVGAWTKKQVDAISQPVEWKQKPFWQKNAEDFESRKAAALKANPGAKVDGENLITKGADGVERTVRI